MKFKLDLSRKASLAIASLATIVVAALGCSVLTSSAMADLVEPDGKGDVRVDERLITQGMRDAYLADIEQRYVPLFFEETSAIARSYRPKPLTVNHYAVVYDKELMYLQEPGGSDRPQPNPDGALLVESGPHGRLVTAPGMDECHFYYNDRGTMQYFYLVGNPGAGDSLVYPFWAISQGYKLTPSPGWSDAAPDPAVNDAFIRGVRTRMVEDLRLRPDTVNRLVKASILNLIRRQDPPHARLIALVLHDPSVARFRPPTPPRLTPPSSSAQSSSNLAPATIQPAFPARPNCTIPHSNKFNPKDRLSTPKQTVRSRKRVVVITVKSSKAGRLVVKMTGNGFPKNGRRVIPKVKKGNNRLTLPRLPQWGNYKVEVRPYDKTKFKTLEIKVISKAKF